MPDFRINIFCTIDCVNVLEIVICQFSFTFIYIVYGAIYLHPYYFLFYKKIINCLFLYVDIIIKNIIYLNICMKYFMYLKQEFLGGIYDLIIIGIQFIKLNKYKKILLTKYYDIYYFLSKIIMG